MKKLAKRISRKEWGMILLAILFTCFSVYLELEVPTYISKITDLLGTQGTNLDELWQPAGMMVGMSFLAFLSAVAVGFFASSVWCKMVWWNWRRVLAISGQNLFV